MKKMKTRYKVLLSIGMFILIITVLLNVDTLPKYEYKPGIYSLSGTIDIDGVIYKEINQDEYGEIYRELGRQGNWQYIDVIGKFNYILGDSIWRYKLNGYKNAENRILMRGEDDYAIDRNCPDVYFCRQDILNSLKNGEIE